MPDRRVEAVAVCLGLLAVLGGCAHRPPVGASLEVVPRDRWPQLTDDGDDGSLEHACRGSERFLEGQPGDRRFVFGPEERSASELLDGVRRACAILASTGSERERMRRLQREFSLLRSVGRDGRGEVLFTGYYEPLIEARRQPEPPFVHPVIGVPDDLVTFDLRDFGVVSDRPARAGRVVDRRLVPYPDRDAIDFGDGLPADTEVLGWVDDPVDLFFLHVQGSGTLLFPDGDRLRAGYAATNGHGYRSIGKLLIDDGLVGREDMSMQAIRAYLEDHPEDLRRVMTYNPSYVFFRPLSAVDGPLGCYGQPLTGGRSIATDRGLFPAPVVGWIRTSVPASGGGDRPIARFVLNQDTGGSIRGPGRVDLFFGQGDEAGALAGRTKHLGELYFLLPKR